MTAAAHNITLDTYLTNHMILFLSTTNRATLGNALIYIFPGIMFRGAVRKLRAATKAQKREVNMALGSALIGAVLGTMGAVKAVQSIL
jgi:hypothetical protein